MLHQNFQIKIGNWLFVRRGWLPILLYFLAISALFYNKEDVFLLNRTWYFYICLSVSLIGIIIRSFTIGYVPKNTSGRNTSVGQLADTINTKGMYSVFRHPLYVGNFFMWLGLIMYVGIDWFILIAITLYFIYYEKIILAEENFMYSKFGKVYEDFCNNTKIITPHIKWETPNLKFSFKNVLKREYHGLFYLIISFILLDVIKNYIVLNIFHITPDLLYIGIAILIFTLVIRIIAKKTSLLNIEGR